MHRFKKFIIHTSYLIIFLIIHTSYFITHTCYGAGESALVILEEPMGARPVGMGEAFTAVADDINALYYNPAGLSFLTRPELSTTYLKGLLDSYYGFAGFVLPFKKSALGLSITHFNGGEMEINTLNPDGSFKESKTVSAEKDFIPMFSYSFVLGPALGFGVNLKMIQSTLVEDYPATAYAADVGLLIRPIGDSFCLGFVTKNLGTPIKYKNLEHPLPMSYKAGVAIKPADWFTISADYEKPDLGQYEKDDEKARGLKDAKLKSRMNFGLEISIVRIFALRAGYKVVEESEDGGFNLGFGLGVAGFLLDYSFAGMKDLDSMHRMSFTTTFGALTNYRKGEGYYKKEMYERAIYWLDKVPEKDVNYAQAKEISAEARKQITSKYYYGEGEKYFNEGEYTQTIEQWQKVIDLLPNYKDTQQRLAVAKSRLEEIEANAAISKAKEKVKEAESIGYDMGQAKKLLKESVNLFENKEFVPAKTKAEEAHQLASAAIGVRKEEPKPLPPPVAPVAPPVEEVPITPPPPPSGERITMAIMDLQAQGVSATESLVITDLLKNAIIVTNAFRVVERGNIQQVMGELGFQQTGCTEQECAIKIGKLLNAKKILIGTVGKLGEAFIITIRMVDVEKGEVEYSDKEKSTTIEDTEIAVEKLAGRMVTKVRR